MTEQQVRKLVFLRYPEAKFEKISHTDDFMPKEADIGKGFYHVSLYAEKLDSSFMFNENDDVIIVDNTYFSSSAYNIAIAWIYELKNGNIDKTSTNTIIKYNLKKFFGEQLYYHNDNVFSRAVLLETLLYEQHTMLPLFDKNASTEWKETVKKTSETMTNLILFHELGHYYLKFQPLTFEAFVQEKKGILVPFLKSIELKYEPTLAEEIKCDVLALYSLLMTGKQTKEELLFALRSGIIGYAILALQYSIRASAKKVAEEQKDSPDNVNLKSIETSTQIYDYYLQIGLNQKSLSVIQRAKEMINLCALIANAEQVNLYGDDGLLPLRLNILDYLLMYIDTKNKNHIMIPTSNNDRNMARLVAEAFHDHPQGMKYLYLKSKVFKSERPLEL